MLFITIVQNGFTHYDLVKMQIPEFLICGDSDSNYNQMYDQSFPETASARNQHRRWTLSYERKLLRL